MTLYLLPSLARRAKLVSSHERLRGAPSPLLSFSSLRRHYASIVTSRAFIASRLRFLPIISRLLGASCDGDALAVAVNILVGRADASRYWRLWRYCCSLPGDGDGRLRLI